MILPRKQIDKLTTNIKSNGNQQCIYFSKLFSSMIVKNFIIPLLLFGSSILSSLTERASWPVGSSR